MRREVVTCDDPAAEAGRRIATRLSTTLERRPWTSLAVSGGSTPGPMFDLLRSSGLPWERIAVLQVDERIAPDGHEDRNLTELRRRLLDHVDAAAHPLPVDVGPTSDAVGLATRTLRAVAGTPPVVDVVHLGLGDDGHTASLVPGDSVCEVEDADIATTSGPYQGRHRLTLTAPTLSRAGLVVWLVVGEAKRPALEALLADDPDIPASSVRADEQIIVTDLVV